MWAGGVAAASAVVAWWRVVGAGYVWLSAGTILLFGVPAALAGAGGWAAAGCAAAALAVAGVRTRAPAWSFAVAAVALVVAAIPDGGVAASVSGAVALGAITAEMMLGHWFLVDPRLPRWSLRRLDAAAGAGMVVDVAVLAVLGAVPWVSGDAPVGIGYLVLAATTVALAAAVWAALGEEGYPAVMAATGLSYLAVLTAIGTVVLGRLLAAGPVLG